MIKFSKLNKFTSFLSYKLGFCFTLKNIANNVLKQTLLTMKHETKTLEIFLRYYTLLKFLFSALILFSMYIVDLM